MKKGIILKNEAMNLLTSLALAVEDLYLKAQAAMPKDQARSFALYREAYLAYHKQKIFVSEQETI